MRINSNAKTMPNRPPPSEEWDYKLKISKSNLIVLFILISMGGALLYSLLPGLKRLDKMKNLMPITSQQDALRACQEEINVAMTEHSWYRSDEYTDRTILRHYCDPIETKTQGVYMYHPKIEVIEESKIGSSSEVETHNLRGLMELDNYFAFDE